MELSGEEQALRRYLTSAGGLVHDGIALLAEDSKKGRKVVAKQDITKGTQLLKVPVNTCFYASSTRVNQQVCVQLSCIPKLLDQNLVVSLNRGGSAS